MTRRPRNCGRSTLKRRFRRGGPMRGFDDLPAPLRAWLAQARLPWGVASVRAAYAKALARTGCADGALAALDQLEHARLSQDTPRVWGLGHPGL